MNNLISTPPIRVTVPSSLLPYDPYFEAAVRTRPPADGFSSQSGQLMPQRPSGSVRNVAPCDH